MGPSRGLQLPFVAVSDTLNKIAGESPCGVAKMVLSNTRRGFFLLPKVLPSVPFHIQNKILSVCSYAFGRRAWNSTCMALSLAVLLPPSGAAVLTWEYQAPRGKTWSGSSCTSSEFPLNRGHREPVQNHQHPPPSYPPLRAFLLLALQYKISNAWTCALHPKAWNSIHTALFQVCFPEQQCLQNCHCSGGSSAWCAAALLRPPLF
mmetsp:Transcript_13377/g.17453  ORF Transcript_13377/g.17453 Transcript_13377/m.17453 type:complete len:205 (-) Transcript_13377:368-982(-)